MREDGLHAVLKDKIFNSFHPNRKAQMELTLHKVPTEKSLKFLSLHESPSLYYIGLWGRDVENAPYFPCHPEKGLASDIKRLHCFLQKNPSPREWEYENGE